MIFLAYIAEHSIIIYLYIWKISSKPFIIDYIKMHNILFTLQLDINFVGLTIVA